MKITVREILIILTALVVIWIIFQISDCSGDKVKVEKPYWEDPNFKPKIIFVDKPYKVKGDSFPYKVPPLIIIQYRDTIIPGDVKCSTDSLLYLVDSMGKELSKVNKQFLLKFPDSPKLVGGNFKIDTMKLDLLNTDGKVSTQIYPVDYTQYQYEWYNNSIRAKKLSEKEKPNIGKTKKLTHNFYVSGGYSILAKVPIITSDYYLRYKRLQLNIEPKLTIETQPQLELNAKLGVKIK